MKSILFFCLLWSITVNAQQIQLSQKHSINDTSFAILLVVDTSYIIVGGLKAFFTTGYVVQGKVWNRIKYVDPNYEIRPGEWTLMGGAHWEYGWIPGSVVCFLDRGKQPIEKALYVWDYKIIQKEKQ